MTMIHDNRYLIGFLFCVFSHDIVKESERFLNRSVARGKCAGRATAATPDVVENVYKIDTSSCILYPAK
jgi:hypothetical protein